MSKYKEVNFEDIPFETAPSDNEHEGFLNQTKAIGARIAQAPFKLAELPGNILRAGTDFLASKGFPDVVPKQEGNLPSEDIANLFGGEKSLKPSNWFLEGIQSTAGNWPLIFFTGGSTLLKTIADLGGSYGMIGAKKLGLGPVAQIGAGVLSGAGFSFAAKALKDTAKGLFKASSSSAMEEVAKDSSSVSSKIGNLKSDLYSKEKEIGSTIGVNTDPIRNKLTPVFDDVEKQLTSTHGFTKSAKNDVIGNIKQIDKLLNKKPATASDVFEVKKLLNGVWSPSKSTEKHFTDRLQGIVRSELNSLAKKNPEWGKAWRQADELHTIENWQTGLSRWASTPSGTSVIEKISSSPAAIGALSIFGGPKFGLYGLAGAALPVTLKQIIKGSHSGIKSLNFINSLSKTKEGQKLMWEIAANSAKNSTVALSSNINKLGALARRFEKQNPSLSSEEKNAPADMSKYKEVKFEDIPF